MQVAPPAGLLGRAVGIGGGCGGRARPDLRLATALEGLVLLGRTRLAGARTFLGLVERLRGTLRGLRGRWL